MSMSEQSERASRISFFKSLSAFLLSSRIFILPTLDSDLVINTSYTEESIYFFVKNTFCLRVSNLSIEIHIITVYFERNIIGVSVLFYQVRNFMGQIFVHIFLCIF